MITGFSSAGGQNNFGNLKKSASLRGRICSVRRGFKFGRGSRERRTPLSEIVTDTPPIWQRDTGQPRRCAMVRPRHKGTPYVIEVTLRPGKYELHGARRKVHFDRRGGQLWCSLRCSILVEIRPIRARGEIWKDFWKGNLIFLFLGNSVDKMVQEMI